jgi:hypothetical protein
MKGEFEYRTQNGRLDEHADNKNGGNVEYDDRCAQEVICVQTHEHAQPRQVIRLKQQIRHPAVQRNEANGHERGCGYCHAEDARHAAAVVDGSKRDHGLSVHHRQKVR